jgi:hypothetical protein
MDIHSYLEFSSREFLELLLIHTEIFNGGSKALELLTTMYLGWRYDKSLRFLIAGNLLI